MKSLSNVVAFYMMLSSILICLCVFTFQLYLIIFEDLEIIEKTEYIYCIESMFSHIIPILVKCSFSFLLGIIVCDWKYLLIGIM